MKKKNFNRIKNYYRKKMSSTFNRKICKIKNIDAVISFTFDDFSRSSYLVGGEILNRYGFKATYYTSFGLMGKKLPVGEGFIEKDIIGILRDGHELGCHTYNHDESWETDKEQYNKSILLNRKKLNEKFPNTTFKTFSYPIANPHPKIKEIAGSYYNCCRGGGQTFNRIKIDTNLLKSYFIDKKNRNDIREIKTLINETINKKAWLIVSTHDIADKPSDFGCSVRYFEELVRYVHKSNISVLTVAETYNKFCLKNNF